MLDADLDRKLGYYLSSKHRLKSALTRKGIPPFDYNAPLSRFIEAIKSIQPGDITLQESKTVMPTKDLQEVSPDSGYNALSKVKVLGDVVLQPWNIREGVTIFGVTGTAKPTTSNKDSVFIPSEPDSPYDPDKPEEMEVPKNIIEKETGQSADTFDVMILQNGTGDVTYGFLEKELSNSVGQVLKRYNGVLLPDIDEIWDKTTYPYAHIQHYKVEASSNVYYLFFTSHPVSISEDGKHVVRSNGEEFAYHTFSVTPESPIAFWWSEMYEGTTTSVVCYGNQNLVWSNFNVLQGWTTICRASEPTPNKGFEITWYDPATTNFKAVGWHRLSYHRQGDYWQSDDFTTVESGGWNYLKHITECTREKLYYKGSEIWPQAWYPLYYAIHKNFEATYYGFGQANYFFRNADFHYIQKGDVLRVTLDGIVSDHVVSDAGYAFDETGKPTAWHWSVGNHHLYAPSMYEDDGTDFYVSAVNFNTEGIAEEATLYVRNPGYHDIAVAIHIPV